MKRRDFVVNVAAIGGLLYPADVQALGGTAVSTGHQMPAGGCGPLFGMAENENEKDVVAANIVTSRSEIEYLRKRGIDVREAMEHKMDSLRNGFLEHLQNEGML